MTTNETQQEIVVTYSAPVHDCRRRLCVFPPMQRGSQQVNELHWECRPEPDSAEETNDEFGNRILSLYHKRIQQRLHFGMKLVTMRDSSNAPASSNLPDSGLGAYLLPSALCDRTPGILELAALLREAADFQESPAAARIARLNTSVHATLVYEAGTTDHSTTASMALGKQTGVCQDFTHLLIALCRALGFPARYVAGYNPAEGVMHAWAEIFYDGLWHAWDPTHNRPTRENCVFVACGRDYRDVLPVAGTYRGTARAKLAMHCRTTMLTIPR